MSLPSDEPDVICVKEGACGTITLNRPKALNAVTHGMVRDMAHALGVWENDPEVGCVLIRAAGERAFCAGGDIRYLYEKGKAGRFDDQLAFFADEYRLNRHIRRYAKPYVSLIDGIVMGGGVGVTLHGTHRVAGDRFSFAMPEVGIGFFPDVGASYFLPRLPNKTGLYLALTGARADGGDAVALGLAGAHVPSARFAALTDRLRNGQPVEAAIAAEAAAPAASAIAAQRGLIDACFGLHSVAAIVDALDATATAEKSAFAAQAAAAIRAKSPSALAITLRQMQAGADLDIEDALRMEYRIAARVIHMPDYYEGVRTTIIDRGMKPAWRPPTIAGVDPNSIVAFFAPLGSRELDFAAVDAAR